MQHLVTRAGMTKATTAAFLLRLVIAGVKEKMDLKIRKTNVVVLSG